MWKGYRPRVRLVLAGGHASAWFSPFWRGPAPGAQRYQAELDFVAIVWSWWRQQPIPSNHPRIPDYELLRKFLKLRAEVLHIPSTHFYAL